MKTKGEKTNKENLSPFQSTQCPQVTHLRHSFSSKRILVTGYFFIIRL